MEKKEGVSEFKGNEKSDDKKRKQMTIIDDYDSSSSSGDSVIVLSQTDPVDKLPIENQNKKHKIQ